MLLVNSHTGATLLTAALSWAVLTPTAEAAKKLVVFVGPQETGGTEVNKFLSRHAIGSVEGTAFDGWIWPSIEGSDVITSSAHHVFDHLVKDQEDEVIQRTLMDAIDESWSKAEKGVVIGSLDLALVGSNPNSGYHPLAAVQRVVDSLGVAAEDVSIVMTYRTPRIDHWAAVWQNHFDEELYEDFICSTMQKNKQWEWIDTVMNQFRVAKAYFDLGWRISIIDQEGTRKAGQDVAHVIACSVMEGVVCDDMGYVSGLQNETTESPALYNITELSQTDKANLEQLFRQRDCYYKFDLDGQPGLQVINGDNIWNTCASERSNNYALLSDTTFFLNAVQSQKGCETFDVEISDLLTNEDIDQPDAGGNKKLVVFVGPHEAHSGDVLSFFESYASANDDAMHSDSLATWTWPSVSSDLFPDGSHRIFDHLVTDASDPTIQEGLIDSIVKAWNSTQNGVIIGSMDFDRVGDNPDTGYDAVGAVTRVVNALGVAAADVTIVTTYPSPHIDQWSRVWQNHFTETEYEDYVCSETQANKRWEWLDTVMNPFRIANVYHDEGWNVAVIDQQGTIDGGMNISHVIACTLMEGVVCDDDRWVTGLRNVTSGQLSRYDIDGLAVDELLNLEELFLQRDCFYRLQLEGTVGYQTFNKNINWRSCDSQRQSYYQQFADTDFLLNAIQSQKGCETTDVDVTALLYKGDAPSGKKLVVFVGPHETEAGDVLAFFESHASTNTSSSLTGWAWPTIKSDLLSGKASHRIFDGLVTSAGNSGVQEVLIDGIVDAWKNADNGVIIGSLDFDKVGENPDTGYDGLAAARRVVDALGISGEDVLVVTTYRSPRIDQWSLLWSNHFEAELYEDFICSDAQAEKRWEWLDTAMNPFMIAKKYYDEGWEVAVIDQEGTVKAGKDISHVIACDFMKGVDCQNGWVTGLENDTIDHVSGFEIDSLDETDRRNLEELFLQRDCYYKYELSDQIGFQIVHQHATWSTCSNQHKAFYKQFTDTDFLLNAIQSQKNCESAEVDVPDMLESKIVVNGNKLVIFAGPHETGAIPILQFFVQHASLYEGTERSASFNGWDWPMIESEIVSKSPHLMFDLLVTDADERPIQNLLMDGIRDSWNNAQKGVIIGAMSFERVGENPDSGYDALGAVQRVVGELEVPDEDVTVVLIYRSPRIDQWGSIWANHFREDVYKDFICSDTQGDKRWEWLDAASNPLKVANAYVEQGFNVVVIDAEGAWNAGHDIAHVISCDIMAGVDCQGGRVNGLQDEATERPSTDEIAELNEGERSDLEQLFQLRDCYYQFDMERSSKVTTLYKDGLWKFCSEKNHDKYERLADTDFFLNALKAHQDCATEAIDLSSILSEDFQSSESSGVSGPIIALIVVFTVVVVMALCLLQRKVRKTKKAKDNPPDGLFRDPASELPGKDAYVDSAGKAANHSYSDESGSIGRYSDGASVNVVGRLGLGPILRRGNKNVDQDDVDGNGQSQDDTMDSNISCDDEVEGVFFEEAMINFGYDDELADDRRFV